GTIDYTFGSAFQFGFRDAFNDLLYQSIIPLVKIFTGEINASESFQGPAGIAIIYGGEFRKERFWYITGLISMVLAFMNFLPIPALDGGHIMFILIEFVIRRRLSDKFLEKAQMVGMFILLT
ncbi:MAG: site-2 protease family protein, partial [Bacteroidetes bacterium]|nr:site-2 protease family protein [Bacteroidota bacterium]